MYVPLSDFSLLCGDLADRTKYPTGTFPFVDADTYTIYWKDTCENTRKVMPDYELSLELKDDNTI